MAEYKQFSVLDEKNPHFSAATIRQTPPEKSKETREPEPPTSKSTTKRRLVDDDLHLQFVTVDKKSPHFEAVADVFDRRIKPIYGDQTTALEKIANLRFPCRFVAAAKIAQYTYV